MTTRADLFKLFSTPNTESGKALKHMGSKSALGERKNGSLGPKPAEKAPGAGALERQKSGGPSAGMLWCMRVLPPPNSGVVARFHISPSMRSHARRHTCLCSVDGTHST